jgi:AcrR family transcriptional regulator/DNA-binding MarR family transcriptional regulator
VRVIEIQRSRLLAAALGAVDELGYPHTTVAHITARARVSRRTFYDLFDDREDCLLAALQSVVEMVGEELAGANLGGLSWRERMRGGLWAMLSFFEHEPAFARVCVVQALRGGPRVLERRERVLAELTRVVDEGRLESSKSGACPPVTAEGLVGAAFAVVYGRLLRGDSEPLTGLFGELMGMIVLPYRGPAAARREQDRPLPAPVEESVIAHGVPHGIGAGERGRDLLAELPMRLTYRTARVLEAIATCSGASNRVVADRAGVSDQGQISKLLARLERIGLLTNTVEEGHHAKGEPNSWSLTSKGAQVMQAIRVHAGDKREVA